jgi:hypothetical protein
MEFLWWQYLILGGTAWLILVASLVAVFLAGAFCVFRGRAEPHEPFLAGLKAPKGEVFCIDDGLGDMEEPDLPEKLKKVLGPMNSEFLNQFQGRQ